MGIASMATYLGFGTTSHDSAIAVLNEAGQLLFAEANERVLKNKRAWNTSPDPVLFLDGILKKYVNDGPIVAGLSWSDDILKWSWLTKKILNLQASFHARFSQLGQQMETHSFRQAMYGAPINNRDMLLNLEYRLFEMKKLQNLKKIGWEHHLCHAATACYSSPFDNAICVIVDGAGEATSQAIFSFENAKIERIKTKSFADFASLGLFYAAVCWACGFDPLAGEEWKVMGLAPYGKMQSEYENLCRSLLKIKNQSIQKSPRYAEQLTKLLSLREKFRSPLEAANLAFAGQAIFEELMCELLVQVHSKWGGANLILGGGCALNSSCNGVLLERTPFKNLHISMAPGDDGNAIGSAYLSWMKDHPKQRPLNAHTAFLGSEISTETIERAIRLGGLKAKFFSENELIEEVSKELSEGKLVGWVQGRAEFGPRALGNRSILADPRKAKTKDHINERIKFREEFRPFAPSILDEKGPELFHNYQYSPYMERTLRFKNTEIAPAVVHCNETGRVQSVRKEDNPRFYALLNSFYKKTKVPVLLNTSFNVMGRPIIHDVEDALAVFFTSGLDMLVLGQYVFKK